MNRNLAARLHKRGQTAAPKNAVHFSWVGLPNPRSEFMAIEFRCTKCNKLLRTPDDTAGKHAKCPECGEILLIPTAGAFTTPRSVGGSGATPPPGGPDNGSFLIGFLIAPALSYSWYLARFLI
jgi:phage FluMu protein Com